MRCDEFYEKWRRCGNFCEKHPDTAREIEEMLDFIDEINEREDLSGGAKAAFAATSARAIRPIIREKDTEVRDRAIEKCAATIKDKEKRTGKKSAKMTEKQVTKVIEDIKKADKMSKIQKDIAAQIDDYPTRPHIDCASCYDWIPLQPDCDLLITDPPYATDVEDINAFANNWLLKALSKVKSTGRAYVFIGAYPDELGAYLMVAKQSDLLLANVLVWTYRNTLGPSPTYDYKLNWQAILYFRGKDAPPLNAPIMTEQFSVQDINAPDGRFGEGRYHKWQKPDELAERLIRHSTSTGDVVMDCFAGTGTFVLAAAKLGRCPIACESDKDMLLIAKNRGCDVNGG